jgi:hypothetical protein
MLTEKKQKNFSGNQKRVGAYMEISVKTIAETLKINWF